MAHPVDFEEKLDLYKDKIDRDVMRWRRDNIDSDLENMAEGGVGGSVGGGGTIRSKFFPGWRDKDFRDLADALASHEHEALEHWFVQEVENEIERLVGQAKMYKIDKRVLRDIVLRALG